MYEYMQDADEWEITSVTQYETERNHPDSPFVVVIDSTWQPNSSIIFKDGKENDGILYKPLTYIDANGNSTEAQYDLYPDNENPAFSFYEWDDYPFPHKPGNIYLLEVWENGKLTIASRIESGWSNQDYIVIEMEEKQSVILLGKQGRILFSDDDMALVNKRLNPDTYQDDPSTIPFDAGGFGIKLKFALTNLGY